MAGLGWGKFKPLLTEAVVSKMQPFQVKYREIMSDQSYLNSVLLDGQLAAEEVAEKTLKEVKDAMGFCLAAKR